MALTSIMVPTPLLAAPVAANVVINGVPYVPTNPIHNINDRLMLPFREISEAVGAQVSWNEANRRITTTFGNRYSIMHVDNLVVTYGTFTRNAQGEMQFSPDSTTRILYVAPTLIGNFTYIPLRAFETLDIEVNWAAHTSTAFVTATPPTAGPETPPQQPPQQPPDNRPPNFGDFSNTSHFRIIGSSTARSMHQDSNNNPFVFVLYNSDLESSKAIVPNIQDLAQELQFRVYGVDMANTNNRAVDNNWLWQTFREAQFQDPTIYFVHSRNNIQQIQAPNNMNVLRDRLLRFRTESETGIAFGDFSNTNYFTNRSDNFIAQEINSRNEFIVVLYNSRAVDAGSGHYVPIIKAAAAQRGVPIYGLDIDRHPNFHRNIDWFSGFRDIHDNDLPTMVLVYRERNRMRYHSQPQTVERAMRYIDEFLDNRATTTNQGSQFNDLPSGTAFINESMTVLRDFYSGRNDSFVIFMYDSSDADYRTMVEAFVNHVNSLTSAERGGIRIYGVNKSSTVFAANRNRANFDWIGISNAHYNTTMPIMVFVENGNINNPTWYPSNVNTTMTALRLASALTLWLQ